MKSVRILLLVLLTLVLPWRGALAQVVHCAGTANEMTHAVVAAPGHDGGHHGGHDGGHDAGPADGHPGAHHHGDDGRQVPADQGAPGAVADAGDPPATAADACDLCTASCASPPILMAPPVLLSSPVVAASAFPALDAPPPSHHSEAQERPPRSL